VLGRIICDVNWLYLDIQRWWKLQTPLNQNALQLQQLDRQLPSCLHLLQVRELELLQHQVQSNLQFDWFKINMYFLIDFYLNEFWKREGIWSQPPASIAAWVSTNVGVVSNAQLLFISAWNWNPDFIPPRLIGPIVPFSPLWIKSFCGLIEIKLVWPDVFQSPAIWEYLRLDSLARRPSKVGSSKPSPTKNVFASAFNSKRKS